MKKVTSYNRYALHVTILNFKSLNFKSFCFSALLLFCSLALQAQNAHYATGEVFIDHSGFMYISTGDTLNLEGAIFTVRDLNETQRGMLSFAGTSEWKSGSNAFVNGFVRTDSTGTFTFPIGQTAYRPARISKSASAAPTDAAYYTPALHNITALQTGVDAVTDESWVIQGATPAVITLSWSSDITSLADDLSKLCIAGWDGTKWVKIASAADAVSPIFESASSLTGTGSVSTAATIMPNTYLAYTLASAIPAVGCTDVTDIDGNTYSVTSLAGLCWTGNMKTKICRRY